jgi:hypothetical protein
MRDIVNAALDIVAALAFLMALVQFTATFATNDYRPIHAAGCAFIVLGLSCVGAARGWRAGAVGVPLALGALVALRA